MASKVKKHGRKMNAVQKMQYVHVREDGSSSACGHTGVHTTRRRKLVSCPHCLTFLKEKSNGS